MNKCALDIGFPCIILKRGGSRRAAVQRRTATNATGGFHMFNASGPDQHGKVPHLTFVLVYMFALSLTLLVFPTSVQGEESQQIRRDPGMGAPAAPQPDPPEFIRNEPATGHWPSGYRSGYDLREAMVDGFNVIVVETTRGNWEQPSPGIWKAGKRATFNEVGRTRRAVFLESQDGGPRVVLHLTRKMVFQRSVDGYWSVLGDIQGKYRASWAFRVANLAQNYAPRPLPTKRHPQQPMGSFRDFVDAARVDYRVADKEFGITDGPTPGSKDTRPQVSRASDIKFLRNGPSRGHWPDGYEISQARTDRAVTGYNLAYAVKYKPFFAIAQYELTEWRSMIDGVLYVFEEVGRDQNMVYLEDKKQNKWVKINVTSRKIMHGPIGGPLITISDISYAGRPDWSYPSYDPWHPNARNVERLVPYILHPSASEEENIQFRAAVAEDYRIGAEERRAEDEYRRQNGIPLDR